MPGRLLTKLKRGKGKEIEPSSSSSDASEEEDVLAEEGQAAEEEDDDGTFEAEKHEDEMGSVPKMVRGGILGFASSKITTNISKPKPCPRAALSPQRPVMRSPPPSLSKLKPVSKKKKVESLCLPVGIKKSKPVYVDISD